MADEMKTRSIRADEATLEKFKALSESFDNQGECLSQLITAYEISNAKHTLTDMKTDIADYESHIQSIQEAFLHVLELNNNAEQRIRQEYAALLQSKDKTIADLQSRSEDLEKEATAAKEKAKEEIELNKMTVGLERDARKTAEKEADMLRSSNIDYMDKAKLHKQLAEERAAENVRLKEELAELKPVKEEMLRLQEQNSTQAAELQSLKADIERMKTEAECSKKIAAAEMKEAIAETKSEYSDKLESLRTEKEKLNDEIAKLKDYIRQLDQMPTAPRENPEDDDPEQLTFD